MKIIIIIILFILYCVLLILIVNYFKLKYIQSKIVELEKLINDINNEIDVNIQEKFRKLSISFEKAIDNQKIKLHQISEQIENKNK